jgi:hypothetical protein
MNPAQQKRQARLVAKVATESTSSLTLDVRKSLSSPTVSCGLSRASLTTKDQFTTTLDADRGPA